MKNLTFEMVEKAKTAKSAEELWAIAKAEGEEITLKEAETYFAQLNPKSGELDDDELDAVAGGKTGCNTAKAEALANQNLPHIVCPNCGAVGDWEYHGSGFTTRGYYCRKCKLQMYLSGDDDFSVLHTNGSIATI